MINISPDKIKSFMNYPLNSRKFCCVISDDLYPYIKFEYSSKYLNSSLNVINLDDADNFFACENTDFLLMINDSMYPKFNNTRSFDKKLHHTSRIIEIPLFSTAPSRIEIAHYVSSLYDTIPEDFDNKVDTFFTNLSSKGQINFYNVKHNSSLIYKCNSIRDKERWLEVGGYTELGTKQVYPCGEIEVSPIPHDKSIDINSQNLLDLNGELIITGPSIVNAGYFPFTRKGQQLIFSKLDSIDRANPIKFKITNGKISQVDSVNKAGLKVVDFFNSLFEIEERYTIVHEIGISFNDKLKHLNGNHFYNELVDYSPDQSGSLHIGLGLLTVTQYHIDLFSLDTSILWE